MALFAIVLAVAFALSFALTPLAAWLGRRWGLADSPGGRRRHAGVVARTGGMALYLAFTGTVLLTQFLPVPRFDLPNENIRLAGLLLGGLIVFVYGLADDRWNLDPRAQLIIQAVACSVAIGHLIFIEYIFSPLDDRPIYFPTWFTLAFSLVWLMGMTNTVNWLDGLDGLAAGVTAIASGVLFINAAFRLPTPQVSVSLLPLALAGACLGFLPWNLSGRAFMGSGALFLGFTLGCLSIIGGAKAAAVLLVMAVPIMDVAWLIAARLRRGQSPLIGGRDHLHFRLADAGYSPRVIVLGYYAFCAAFGGLALLVSSRLYKLIALTALGALAICIMWLAERRGNRPPTEK